MEEKEPLLSVARTPGGQRILTVRPAGDGVPVEQWVPFLGEEKTAVLGEDTVVMLGKRGLYTFISGQLLRAGPPVSQGSGVLTPLEGIARKTPDEWLGWAGDQIFASHDEGRSWFQVGRVPQSPLRAIAFLKTQTVLAEPGTGALLRSEDFGRTWKTSTSPLDAHDFALASGRTTTPDNPFECVLGTSPASMKIHYQESGCFNVFGGRLSVQLSPGEALLSVERYQGERRGSRCASAGSSPAVTGSASSGS
ncbi:WD40/YVTN/BNR-like repeat-containing protein [Cystobacter fuscus]